MLPNFDKMESHNFINADTDRLLTEMFCQYGLISNINHNYHPCLYVLIVIESIYTNAKLYRCQ